MLSKYAYLICLTIFFLSCAEIRESETVVKDRGYTIKKKTWYSKDHKRTQKYEWISVDSTGTIVGKKYRNRFGKSRGWSNVPDRYQSYPDYLTTSKRSYHRKTGSFTMASEQITRDTLGNVVTKNIKKRNGDCVRWSYDYALDNPLGFRTLIKINNCGRASNDLTPSGYVVMKRWNPEGKLVDIQRYKKDGRVLVFYRYFENGNWHKIDHADNEIWNRFYSD